jgi:putative antitoxin of VapBC-like toxin-antitoxin system
MRDADGMRTTLDIDDDVLQAVKELGGMHKKTAGQILSDLARKALAPAPPPRGRVRNGVPLLPSRPGAPIMTMADVNRLRDDA